MTEKQMTPLKDWDGIDPTGWIMAEKLDGCRAVWDGHQFWTRSGNIIAAPEWFTCGLPADQVLDGELWAGRGGFALASNAARLGTFTDRISFQIFDRIDGVGKWTDRLASVRHSCAFADVVEHLTCNRWQASCGHAQAHSIGRWRGLGHPAQYRHGIRHRAAA